MSGLCLHNQEMGRYPKVPLSMVEISQCSSSWWSSILIVRGIVYRFPAPCSGLSSVPSTAMGSFLVLNGISCLSTYLVLSIGQEHPESTRKVPFAVHFLRASLN